MNLNLICDPSNRAHKAKDKVVMTCCVARWPPVHLLESVFLTLDGADATLHLLSKESVIPVFCFPVQNETQRWPNVGQWFDIDAKYLSL